MSLSSSIVLFRASALSPSLSSYLCHLLSQPLFISPPVFLPLAPSLCCLRSLQSIFCPLASLKGTHRPPRKVQIAFCWNFGQIISIYYRSRFKENVSSAMFLSHMGVMCRQIRAFAKMKAFVVHHSYMSKLMISIRCTGSEGKMCRPIDEAVFGTWVTQAMRTAALIFSTHHLMEVNVKTQMSYLNRTLTRLETASFSVQSSPNVHRHENCAVLASGHLVVFSLL